MSTNTFIFAWDENGIESIVPITQYEDMDKRNLFNMLKDAPLEKNPLNGMIRTMILRATLNSHRHYEIYAVDCDESLDEAFWFEQWAEQPQAVADLVREKGVKIMSNRGSIGRVHAT